MERKEQQRMATEDQMAGVKVIPWLTLTAKLFAFRRPRQHWRSTAIQPQIILYRHRSFNRSSASAWKKNQKRLSVQPRRIPLHCSGVFYASTTLTCARDHNFFFLPFLCFLVASINFIALPLQLIVETLLMGAAGWRTSHAREVAGLFMVGFSACLVGVQLFLPQIIFDILEYQHAFIILSCLLALSGCCLLPVVCCLLLLSLRLSSCVQWVWVINNSQ